MQTKTCKLIKKEILCDDIYELFYECDHPEQMLPWQFITLRIPEVRARSYSICELKDSYHFSLIVKKWTKKQGGRWGSFALCEANIWQTYTYFGPLGHFVLSDCIKNRLFIGTGTGLVPLYNQIISWLQRWEKENYTLFFGTRYKKDIFYEEKLSKLSHIYTQFQYSISLSRENSVTHKQWYVTALLDENTIIKYDEFYICWDPKMIASVQELLQKQGISPESIFFEKYF